MKRLLTNACDNIADAASIIHARRTRSIVLMTRSKWIPAMVCCSAGCTRPTFFLCCHGAYPVCGLARHGLTGWAAGLAGVGCASRTGTDFQYRLINNPRARCASYRGHATSPVLPGWPGAIAAWRCMAWKPHGLMALGHLGPAPGNWFPGQHV